MLDGLKLEALAAAYEHGADKLLTEARLALTSGDGQVFVEKTDAAKRTRRQATIFREMAKAA